MSKTTFYPWEFEKVEKWTLNEIKNRIWNAVHGGYPIPGNVTVELLRAELLRRGEEPIGYHNT